MTMTKEEEQKEREAKELSDRIDDLLKVPYEWRLEMHKKLRAEFEARARADEFVKLIIELARKFFHAKTYHKKI